MDNVIFCNKIFGNSTESLEFCVNNEITNPYFDESCLPCDTEKLCSSYSISSANKDQETNVTEYPPDTNKYCLENNSSINKPREIYKDNVKWRCKKKKSIAQKYQVQKKSSLGRPIGVCYGEFNLYTIPSLDGIRNNDKLFGLAACIVALGELYLTAESVWDCLVISRVLRKSQELIKNSIKENEELNENDIKKRFLLCGNTIEIHIDLPFVIGRLSSNEPRIWNLQNALKSFLRKRSYCLLTVNEMYFLIWKCRSAIFIFDPYGRDTNLTRNTIIGYAVLMCVMHIENLVHFILEMSDLQPNELFTLREIKVIEIIPCCDKVEDFEHMTRKTEYNVLTPSHAILRGHIHVDSDIFYEFRYKQALTVVFIGIIFSKIDAPNTWDSHVIDRIVAMGTNYYKIWTNCDLDRKLNPEDIPKSMKIGQFTVETVIYPTFETGLWMLTANYKQSDLTIAIMKTFNVCANFILQIMNKSYALWKRGGYYYIFDPYAHICINRDHSSAASVHMCSTIDMLCCVLTQEIIEIMDSVCFYIHAVAIRLIHKGNSSSVRVKKQNVHCRKFQKSNYSNKFDEIESLNESIIDPQCEKLLTEFYEQEHKDDFVDLDYPGLSETQLVIEYKEIKSKMLDSNNRNTENEDEDDYDDDDEEEEGEEESDGLSKASENGDEDSEEEGKLGSKKRIKKKIEKSRKKRSKKGKQRDKKRQKDKHRRKKGKRSKSRDKKKGKDRKGKSKHKKKGKSGSSSDETTHSKKSKKSKSSADEISTKSIEDQSILDEEVICNDAAYPGYSTEPYKLALVCAGTSNRTHLIDIIQNAFKDTDRILVMTETGNIVIFKRKDTYLIYEGCTCNIDIFKHMDITVGTAGLTCFYDLDDLIEQILNNEQFKRKKTWTADEICEEFANKEFQKDDDMIRKICDITTRQICPEISFEEFNNCSGCSKIDENETNRNRNNRKNQLDKIIQDFYEIFDVCLTSKIEREISL